MTAERTTSALGPVGRPEPTASVLGPGGRPEPAASAPGANGRIAGEEEVLTGLRRHARQLLDELAGPVRRVRLRSGDTVLEVEWHGWAEEVPAPRPAAPAPSAPATTAAAAPPAPSPPVAAPAPAAGRSLLRSPIVGTFYRAPEPGAAPFIAVGDMVRPGQVIGIVEAMKLMNEVTADRAGRVVELLVEDGQPVEYDQPLVALETV